MVAEEEIGMFKHGDFTSHSGLTLPFKVDCDDLTDEDIECFVKIINSRAKFGVVIGVPTGGLRLAEALKPYCIPEGGILIVDDVLTTGSSMEKHYVFGAEGIVLFARGECPPWVYPIWSLDPTWW